MKRKGKGLNPVDAARTETQTVHEGGLFFSLSSFLKRTSILFITYLFFVMNQSI